MIVEFYMETDGECISYKTIGSKHGQVLDFLDQTSKGTRVYVEPSFDGLIIRRMGTVEMEQTFLVGKKTTGRYCDEFGLVMELEIQTKKLQILENEIFLEYDLFLHGEHSSMHKMIIKY